MRSFPAAGSGFQASPGLLIADSFSSELRPGFEQGPLGSGNDYFGRLTG
jgi:hypothetical protein